MRGIEQDPLMVQPQPQIRYPTSPASPDKPNAIKELAIDKGAEIGMQMATDALFTGAGAAVGGPAGAVIAKGAQKGIYEGLIKPMFSKYFDNGGMVGGPLSPMMTNVSKVRYKQSGGKVAEEIELNYHGPLASKGV